MQTVARCLCLLTLGLDETQGEGQCCLALMSSDHGLESPLLQGRMYGEGRELKVDVPLENAVLQCNILVKIVVK